MLVTPLEVYASVSSASLKRTLPSQRLVISQNSEATPIIIVQDDQRPKENQARFKYTDCRFVTGQQPHYEEHVKQLVTSFTEGYNTAGVSVYAKSNDPESQKRNMTGMALDLLKEQLLQKYVLSGDSESRNIKLEYGFIGFSDFRCYNYPSRTKLHNDKAMKMNVTDFLLPLPIDKIDDTWKTIKFDQNGGDPTLFICNLTRNNKLESCFAWLNFSAPSDSATYYASYAEMEKRLLVYSDPKFNGILDPYEYPMAAFTFNYFSGLYQTKVFAHFDEYGIYDTGINLDLLRDTSNWGNIKCSVSRNEFGVNLGKSQKKALQRELDEQTLTINQLKTTCSNQQETLTKLNEEIETYKPLEYRHKLISNVGRATMEKQKAIFDMEKVDLVYQLNTLKMRLVETNMMNYSYQSSNEELACKNASQERLIKDITQLHVNNARYIDELEQEVNRLNDRPQNDMYATLTQQWKATEKTYRQRLEKKKSRVDRLLKQVQSLTLECTQLKKRNKAIQQQMDNMIKRLEMKDDAGSSTMRRDSRELVDMAQQGDLAQYQTTHGSLNDWAQKQDLSQQLLQSQLLLQSLLTQCQEPLSSNSLTLLSRLQAQASPSSKHQALSLSSKTQHVAPPSQRPVTLHSQASSKPLKIPQPRSPAQSLPLSSPHLPSQSQLPAQPRSPSPPSSPLQHQAPSSPLSPLQHQAPSSPLSPLQHQAPPQSRSPSPSPLQPLSPLQPQAPSSPLSPQVHSPSKTPQSTHSSHKRQSVSPKNVMTSPVLGMETITYNQHNRYTSEESNNDPVRPSSPEISSPVHDLLSSFDEKLDLRTHNANIKSTPKSTHHDASTPSRSKASENTTPILDMSPRSPTLPASHQRHTSPLPITEERRTDSDGFSLHDSVPSLPDEESLFLSPTTSKPASQSKINIDLTALEEDEPVRRKPLSKQPSSEATIQPSASTSKRGKKPLERRKLSLKWQQIEVPDQQGPVHNKQLSSSQTPVRNKFVQHKEPTSSQKSLQSKFVVKRSILSQKSVQDNELTSSQELTMTRKKRRRLINRSPIDETRMSPLLNGYSAKYFDIE